MIQISHKIALQPNNRQKTYFRKAFGCARLAYNWALAEWKRIYEEGGRPNKYEIKKKFNALKKEQFPFVYEVTKYATQQPIMDLGKAFDKFFRDLKKGVVSYPKFKKKKDNEGSFYIGGDQIKLSKTNKNKGRFFKKLVHNENAKCEYLSVPNLGWVKMSEALRFSGKVSGVVISQHGDRFFASFSVSVTEEEYQRTHRGYGGKKNKAVGIDLGIKTALVLSDGIGIDNPKPLKQNLRKVKKLSKQLSKRVHPKTKEERLRGVKKSNNYMKLSRRLSNVQRHIGNIRRDFTNKVTSIITDNYSSIVLEDLNVKGMTKNHHLAQAVLDVGFFEFRRELEYKSAYKHGKVMLADRFYPSSKTCSSCGYIKKDLTLNDRVYFCPACGLEIDRDYNAALNLRQLSNDKIGAGRPELTSVDMAALLSCFERNGIATSMVEAEIQQKLRN